MKNFAFTLAETLVTLTILGIIMAITIPLMNKARPDKDVIIYKKALYSLQSAVGNATELLINEGAQTNLIWSDSNIIRDSGRGFCERVAEHLNTSKENCNINGLGSYDNPQIITTDGIRFWKLKVGLLNRHFDAICVDRTFTDKELKTLSAVRQNHNPSKDCYSYSKNGISAPVGLRVAVRNDGKVTTDYDSYEFQYENELINRSFDVKAQR